MAGSKDELGDRPGVTVDDLAFARASRRLGSGVFVIELVRSDGGSAIAAVHEALDAQPIDASLIQVALTPRGAGVIIQSSARSLIVKATALAFALERAGVAGSVQPYGEDHPAFSTPQPGTPRSLIGAGWVIDRRQLTARSDPDADPAVAWGVTDVVTDNLVTRTGAWLAEPHHGDWVFSHNRYATAKSTHSEALALLRAALRIGGTAAVSRWVGPTDFRQVTFDALGHIVVATQQPDWTQALSSITALTEQSLTHLEYAFIKGSMHPVSGWNALLSNGPTKHVPGPQMFTGVPDHRELEHRLVPDTFPIQYLSAAQLSLAGDLSGWQIQPVEHLHMVSRPDPRTWIVEGPERADLRVARDAFGAMILTRAHLQEILQFVEDDNDAN